MAPYPPPPAGNEAGGPPAPPLDPSALIILLDQYPVQAAALLGAMRPQLRQVQAEAHAVHTGVPIAYVMQAWAALLSSSPLCDMEETDDNNPVSGAVFEPLMLAALHPNEARTLVASLSERQKVLQALAQSCWLNEFGFTTTWMDFMAAWSEPPSDLRRAG